MISASVRRTVWPQPGAGLSKSTIWATAGGLLSAPDGDASAPARSRRPRRADAERNRRALLAAARRVFERDGFVGARITDIADEAGAAHGCFYSHFPGKEEIFAAVVARCLRRCSTPARP
jgi:Bacterial regulatory proteins, tetR family